MAAWHVCLVRERHRLHTGSASIGTDVESPHAELTAIKKEWQRQHWQNCQRENDDSWIEVHRSLGECLCQWPSPELLAFGRNFVSKEGRR